MMEHVATEISTVVSRMRSLSITNEDYFGSEFLTSTIGMDQPAPLLESLRIRITEYGSDYPANNIFPLPDSFTPSPKLKILEIPLFRMNFEHLPHLSMATTLIINANKFYEPLVALDALEYLLESPNVAHLGYKCTDGFEWDPVIYWRLFLDHKHRSTSLRSVDLTIRGGGLDILLYLDAPFLTSLRIDGWNDKPIRHFQAKRLSRALKLTAEHSVLVRRLELLHVTIGDPIEDYQALVSGVRFPALEELVIESSDISGDALINADPSVSNLKKLEIKNCEHLTTEDARRFREARSGELCLIFNGICL